MITNATEIQDSGRTNVLSLARDCTQGGIAQNEEGELNIFQ